MRPSRTQCLSVQPPAPLMLMIVMHPAAYRVTSACCKGGGSDQLTDVNQTPDFDEGWLGNGRINYSTRVRVPAEVVRFHLRYV